MSEALLGHPVFIIVPEEKEFDPIFLKENKSTYIHSVSKEKEFRDSQPTLRNSLRYFVSFCPTLVLQLVTSMADIPQRNG